MSARKKISVAERNTLSWLTDNFQLRDVVIEGRQGLDVKKSPCQRIHSGRRSETAIDCNVV